MSREVCRFFKFDNPGSCTRGNECSFAHLGPNGIDVRKNPKGKELELL